MEVSIFYCSPVFSVFLLSQKEYLEEKNDLESQLSKLRNLFMILKFALIFWFLVLSVLWRKATSTDYYVRLPILLSTIAPRSTCCMYRYWPVFILFAHLVLNQFMRELSISVTDLLPHSYPDIIPHFYWCRICKMLTDVWFQTYIHHQQVLTRETNENLMQQIERMENSHNFSKTGKDSLKKNLSLKTSI